MEISSRKPLSSHDACVIANIHSGDVKYRKCIPPTWNRVSRTPWQDKKDLCGGYGQRMKSTMVSFDAPDFFKNSEKYRETAVKSNMGQEDERYNTIKRDNTLLACTKHEKQFKTLLFNKQVLMEANITPKKQAKIEWK